MLQGSLRYGERYGRTDNRSDSDGPLGRDRVARSVVSRRAPANARVGQSILAGVTDPHRPIGCAVSGVRAKFTVVSSATFNILDWSAYPDLRARIWIAGIFLTPTI
jgi:hypothetical protein